MMSTGLTRKDKEKFVVELYKRGMTYAQIAKEAHVSLRDIGPILNRAGEHQSLSYSSQAYKMFSEGSTPAQVAVALNLREKEVSEYYREYWNLNGLYNLKQMYNETKGDIWPVVELHRRIMSEGLSPLQVGKILKKTITLEHTNRDLERENVMLEIDNKKAAQTFQQFTNLILKDNKTLEENSYVISQQKREIENLNIEEARLEITINSIRLDNEIYIKIKQKVKQEIESIVSNPRMLLRLALASLFESSRKHPGKFQALYYNMSPPLSLEQILSQSSISQNASQYEYSDDEKILLDEAELSYNRLVDAITNSCINRLPNDTEPPSQVLRFLDTQDGLSSASGNHKIFDTRDLSQVNFVYNNITFQVHPDPKITNESNNETDVMPGEDESDTYSFLQEQQE